ncbi:MAG TPA: MFS transporter [Acidimicrobiales bacterium]|nr:MFS transporter [Acidimicrobiales bacterium]
MAKRLLLDLVPLRQSRDFRLLFAGQIVSIAGSQLTGVAIPFQVYAETRSSLQVGAVSLAQLGPLVLGALAGGALAGAFDRRRLLVACCSLLALTSLGLSLNAWLVPGPHGSRGSLLAVYLVSACAAALGGIVSSASGGIVPTLVESGQLTAAYATMQVVDQVGMVSGPAIAGVLIGTAGLGVAYGLDAFTFAAWAVVSSQLSPMPPTPGSPRPGLAAIGQGLGYVRRRQLLLGAFLVDLDATIFGAPRALFPALTRTVFHGGARTLGCLYAAPAAGALVAAVTTGWLATIRRRALTVVAAVCAWGACIVAFGLARRLWLALVLLGLAGAADVVSAVLRDTILQTSVGNALRAQIASLQMAVVEGGPRLGDLEAGAVASVVSTQFSILSGGVACIAGAIALALFLPGFRGDRGAGADPADGDRPEPTAAGEAAPLDGRRPEQPIEAGEAEAGVGRRAEQPIAAAGEAEAIRSW